MFFYLRRNNPRKSFKHWPMLLDDLFLGGMSISQAAKKWGITDRAIYRYLDTRGLFEYYQEIMVNGKAAAPAPKIFLPMECITFREKLRELYDHVNLENLQYITVDQFPQIGMGHVTTCKACQKYEQDLRHKTAIPLRLDCPSLRRLIEHHSENTPYDAGPVKHMHICNFCKYEYLTLLKRIKAEGPKPIDTYMWVEEEAENLYPVTGWRDYLNSSFLKTIIDVLEERNGRSQVRAPEVRNYFDWRSFRDRFRDF